MGGDPLPADLVCADLVCADLACADLACLDSRAIFPRHRLRVNNFIQKICDPEKITVCNGLDAILLKLRWEIAQH